MENEVLKNRWIAMRNKGNVEPQLLYEYAIHFGSKLTPHEFSAGLNFQDISAIVDEVDKKFELTTLHDKNGNFIKIVN